MKRRGQHVPPQALAEREQMQAEHVAATVERVEHYLMLKKKFGPREGVLR